MRDNRGCKNSAPLFAPSRRIRVITRGPFSNSYLPHGQFQTLPASLLPRPRPYRDSCPIPRPPFLVPRLNRATTKLFPSLPPSHNHTIMSFQSKPLAPLSTNTQSTANKIADPWAVYRKGPASKMVLHDLEVSSTLPWIFHALICLPI